MSKEDRRLRILELAFDLSTERSRFTDVTEILKIANVMEAWVTGWPLPADWYASADEAADGKVDA